MNKDKIRGFAGRGAGPARSQAGGVRGAARAAITVTGLAAAGLAFSAGLPGAGFLGGGSGPAQAQEATRPEAQIAVTGEGKAQAAPDMAVLLFGVLTQAKVANEAVKANNTAMGKVLAAMKDQGLADRDLQTTGFQIVPRSNPRSDSSSTRDNRQIDGYTVTNTLALRLRDLDKLGTVIDAAVALGINQGGDILFTNDKPEALLEEARKAAMADAIAKAKTLATAAGVRLGRVVSISENSARPMPMQMEMMRKAELAPSASAGMAIAAGETSYQVTVNITYAIEQ